MIAYKHDNVERESIHKIIRMISEGETTSKAEVIESLRYLHTCTSQSTTFRKGQRQKAEPGHVDAPAHQPTHVDPEPHDGHSERYYPPTHAHLHGHRKDVQKI